MTSKRTVFTVDGKPFIAIAGESHNSSSSDAAYMQGVWDKAEEEGLNTLLLPVTWELTEPVEGQFDFTLVDTLINQARERKIHGIRKMVVLAMVRAWILIFRCRLPDQNQITLIH